MQALRKELGDELPRFIIGSGFERRNPVSGLPAFSPENEEDDEGVLSGVLSFLSGLLESMTGPPSPVRFPIHRRVDPNRLSDQPRNEADLETRRRMEGTIRRGGGGGFAPNPKLHRPGMTEEEPLV